VCVKLQTGDSNLLDTVHGSPTLFNTKFQVFTFLFIVITNWHCVLIYSNVRSIQVSQSPNLAQHASQHDHPHEIEMLDYWIDMFY
jgi:hypothetical protein